MGLAKGSRLGKYLLTEQIGSGGMGVVFLAEHVVMRRKVAIKVLPARLVKDARALDRFHREAQAIAALDHPNIVRAYSVDNEGSTHYLVMEYVQGRDLERIVEDEGPLEPDRAARFIRQAADGLAHAHARGLVHRDIKPSNLLIDGNGSLRILDLGLACAVSTGEPKGTAEQQENVVGTTDYLAPEQAMGARDIDGRADIYSLGCTLYFLLTGAPPFSGESLAERLMKHQMEQPPDPADVRPRIPSELSQICQRMMAKKPEERFTAEELRDALFELYPPAEGERTYGSSTSIRKPKLPSADDSALNFGPPAEGHSSSGVYRSGDASAIGRQQSQRTLVLALGGGAVSLVLLAGVWLALSGKSKTVALRDERGRIVERPAVVERTGSDRMAISATKGRKHAFVPTDKNLWPGSGQNPPNVKPPEPAKPPEPVTPAVVDLSKKQSVFTRVDEAREYTLVYHLKLPDEARFNGRAVPYAIDNRAEIREPYDRVAWCLELQTAGGELQYAYVSCDAWSQDLAQIGVPCTAAKAKVQMELKNLNVFSNSPNLQTGSGQKGGIEFWDCNYGPNNAMKVPGATEDKYDFGDGCSNNGGYGSMQVHNWDAKQTIFAYNNWGGGAGEAGIGNQSSGNPDWTFTNNIRSYTTRELYVLVRMKPAEK